MYILIKLIASLVIFLTLRCTLAGKDNIPKQGPYLIVANHLSVSDPVLIGVKLGRRVIFMAKEELFRNRFLGYFIRQFGAFPVYRGQANLEAIYRAKEILKRGGILGMFPEGKRSSSGSMAPAALGSALIAYHNRSIILPVGITGSEQVRGLGWIWHRPKVKLAIGQPFYLEDTGQRLTKEELVKQTEIIMKHIAELLPEKYQGKYAAEQALNYGN